MQAALGPVFRHQHRVTYRDVTIGDHIYYSRYFDLLEGARGEMMRAAGFPVLELQNSGYIFPVIECSARYLAPARYDDVLTIELWLGELSRLRITVEGRILNARGETLLTATTRHVCTSPDEKPLRMPKELHEVMKQWLRKEADAPVSEGAPSSMMV